MFDEKAAREQAYKWACRRAHEEGNVDIDKDYEIIEAWEQEYYDYLKEMEHAPRYVN